MNSLVDDLMKRLFGAPQPCRGGWRESVVRGNCSRVPSAISFPYQPLNTVTNLAYPVVGWACYFAGAGSVDLVFALAMTLLGAGSALYHGWPTDRTNRLDRAGMHATFLTLLAAAFGSSDAVAVAVALLGAYGFSRFRVDINLAMGVTLGLTLWVLSVDYLPQIGVASLAVFLAAFVLWLLDRQTTWAGRWGHALWHVLTAAAIGLMYGAT